MTDLLPLVPTPLARPPTHPRLSSTSAQLPVFGYIFTTLVWGRVSEPGEWKGKQSCPLSWPFGANQPINNYGWSASPIAHGMGILSPSAQPWAARPPWEPFSQATEDGQQARAKLRLTAEEESSFFLTFFQPSFETVIVCLSVVSLRRVADCFIPLYLSLYGASFSFKAVLHCI